MRVAVVCYFGYSAAPISSPSPPLSLAERSVNPIASFKRVHRRLREGSLQVCPPHRRRSGSVSEVSRECRGSVAEVSRKCRGSVSEVSRECLGSVSEVSRKCLGSVSEVSTYALNSAGEIVPRRGEHDLTSPYLPISPHISPRRECARLVGVDVLEGFPQLRKHIRRRGEGDHLRACVRQHEGGKAVSCRAFRAPREDEGLCSIGHGERWLNAAECVSSLAGRPEHRLPASTAAWRADVCARVRQSAPSSVC